MKLKNPSRKGITFEREFMRLLKDHGYSVMRSAASKGVFDLMAYRVHGRTKDKLFIVMFQAKRVKID